MHVNEYMHTILAFAPSQEICKVHVRLTVTPEMLDTEVEVSLTLGTAGSIHILLAYPYFIEVLIMLSDGSDGDLIRSFLISHSFHNDLFLT